MKESGSQEVRASTKRFLNVSDKVTAQHLVSFKCAVRLPVFKDSYCTVDIRNNYLLKKSPLNLKMGISVYD